MKDATKYSSASLQNNYVQSKKQTRQQTKLYHLLLQVGALLVSIIVGVDRRLHRRVVHILVALVSTVTFPVPSLARRGLLVELQRIGLVGIVAVEVATGYERDGEGGRSHQLVTVQSRIPTK